MNPFAKAIREERGNLNYYQLRTVTGIRNVSFRSWESGALPRTQTFNKLVELFGWSKAKATRLAKWIEKERINRKENKEIYMEKAIAYDRISQLVHRGEQLHKIVDVVVDTTEKLEE